MVVTLICILSYLLGSISFAMLIGKGLYKKNLREEGSGNLGTTNTFRVLGKKAGFAVAFLDISKGVVASLMPYFFQVDIHPILPGIFAIVGHVYPLFFGFKGGKAVATASGVILVYSPLLFFGFLIVFLTLLAITKIMSLSSILVAWGIALFSLFNDDRTFLYFAIFICLFVTYKHKDNIRRIWNKEEPTVQWLSRRKRS